MQFISRCSNDMICRLIEKRNNFFNVLYCIGMIGDIFALKQLIVLCKIINRYIIGRVFHDTNRCANRKRIISFPVRSCRDKNVFSRNGSCDCVYDLTRFRCNMAFINKHQWVIDFCDCFHE